jgi:choice-of-anchor B domain-containing protein
MFYRYVILRYCLFVLLFSKTFLLHGQFNLVQRSAISFPNQTTAGVWHYVDSLNNEYALVGTKNGISIVDVTDPDTCVFILQVPGISNSWKEVKASGPYAYAVTEGADTSGDGLQIIDLRYLPDSAPAHYWNGDGSITGLLHNAHSVTVDNRYIYINGHHIAALHGGVIIADLNDPLNPHYLGADTMNYCHDSYVRGDTLWASEINAGQFAAYDITDRTHPVLLASHPTPNAFNHNSWLSDNGHVLFTTDEVNHAPLAAYDVSDFSNIELLDQYAVLNTVIATNNDEVHNVRVLNDFLINACYGSQVTIVDAARPVNLIEVGNFPIYTSLSWDADPFLPSGNILATGRTTGLVVLTPSYVRACYLEGIVTDSLTGVPLNGVNVQILSTYVDDNTIETGEYKTGYPTAGNYSVQFSKTGYQTKTITGVNLANGILTTLNVLLAPGNIGTDDMNERSEISISPNPFHEATQLTMNEDLFNRCTSITVTLKDITGRTVLKNLSVTSPGMKITRGKLSEGIYLYEVMDNQNIIANGKLVIE